MTNHSNLLRAGDSALLIVDVQPRLTAAMPPEDAEKMLANGTSLIDAASRLGVPIFVTEQYPKGLGPTEETLAAKLPGEARVFDKTGFSCCAADGFAGALQASGRSQVIVAGQEAHVCVLQSALDLIHRGYQVHVLADAVCSRDPEHRFYALERMRTLGVTVTNYESVLFEWLRDAAHPQFKDISALLR